MTFSFADEYTFSCDNFKKIILMILVSFSGKTKNIVFYFNIRHFVLNFVELFRQVGVVENFAKQKTVNDK